MSLTEMSFFGGVMILAIVVIRAVALHRLPKRVFCILWGLTVLRLLVPVSVPSPLRVYAGPAEIVETVRPVRPAAAMPETAAPAPAYVSVDRDQTRSARVPVRLVVWGTGTVLCAAFFTASYVNCRRKFSGAGRAEQAQAWLAEHRLRRPLSVRQCGEISAPLTYGVLRPVILVPAGMDWGEQSEWVLEHEFVHVRRFDAAAKLLLTAAVCVHWFNPLVWVMYVLANRDIELSCDDAVVRRFGLGKKSAYALALISMEETKSGLSPLASSFSRNAIEERITAIMKIKKTSAAAVMLAAVLVCGVSVGFAASAEERPEDLRKYLTRVTSGEEYTREEDQRLQSLWFDGYENMTVADYQEKMWTACDHQKDRELIERFSQNQTKVFYYVHDDKDEKANRAIEAYYDYFFNIYEPLTAENWQSRSFSHSALMDGRKEHQEATPARLSADLEYVYMLNVLDAEKLTVGEYQQTLESVIDTMTNLLWERTETELQDGDYMDAFLDREISALAGRLSSGSIQVQISFLFRPIEADGSDADLYQDFSESVGQNWDELLAPYLPFGLTYKFYDPDNDGNGLTMYYHGREVRGIMDEQENVWLTEHAGNGLYAADAIELYTIYENGKLVGLRPATAEEQAEWDRIREQNRRMADTIPSDSVAPQQDPREFPNATEEDYKSFLKLMDGSADSTLSEFNQRLLDWGNANPDAYNRIMCDVGCSDYAVTLSEEETQFAAVTCNLSGTENGMYVRSIYTGRPEEDPGFSENLPERMTAVNGITVAWCDLYYQCSYQIADKSAVTVRERDEVIGGFRQGIRDFWNNSEMDELLSMTEEQAVDKLNRIASEHSTASVRINPMTAEDIHLETMDEREHN